MLFVGVVANVPAFWLFIVVVPAMCILPIFAGRVIQRQIWPAAYQVVQEIAQRERQGEHVGDGVDAEKDRLRTVMSKASRLIQRRVLGIKTKMVLQKWVQPGRACSSAFPLAYPVLRGRRPLP